VVNYHSKKFITLAPVACTIKYDNRK
jgi:hypothetical protein